MHSASSSVCKKKILFKKKSIYINHKGIKRKLINTTKNTLKDIKNLLGTY